MRKNVLLGQLNQLNDALVSSSKAVQVESPATILVDSPEFQDNGHIPRDFTANGRNLFPSIGWSGVPAKCQTLALVIEDPDAPRSAPFVHGIFYNIPPDLIELTEDAISINGISEYLMSRGVMVGKNSRDIPAYTPPAPPSGSGPHHYHFQLFALDTRLKFADTPIIGDLKLAIDGHVIGAGELVGIYEE